MAEPSDDAGQVSESAAEHRPRLRAIVLAAAVIAAFFTAVGLTLYFKPGGDADPEREPSLNIFSAGPAADFAPATITYFQHEHFYLVRFSDGAFLALYDVGPLTQANVESRAPRQDAPPKPACRVKLVSGDQTASLLGAGIGLRGFDSTALRDDCSGVVWDASGERVSGPPSGNLDRFPTATIADIVRVDLGERRCMNEITTQSPCMPTR